MQSHVSATFESLECRSSICVVDGYGVQIRVSNKCLVVSDGIGRFRRQRVFAKALADIKRLVVIGHGGAVTLEALRWMNDAGIAFVQIDRDGELLTSSVRIGHDDVRLRRALALAPQTAAGLEIARYVLCEKVAGQEMVLWRPEFEGNAEKGISEISSARAIAEKSTSLTELLAAESRAAAAYWEAWADLELRFAKKDQRRIPAHWLTFGQRSSPITGSPRLAANPGNALLNYLYALLEQETRIACLACGLDPGMGVFHQDQRSRDSLALDLMEAVRPMVDSYLLDMLSQRTFTAADFVETRRGVCRVLAPMTHKLAETSFAWSRDVAPVVEQATQILAATSSKRIDRLASWLTQSKRSAARPNSGKRGRKATASSVPKVERNCPDCGGSLPVGRQYCDTCLPAHRQETLPGFWKAGQDALARRRAANRDGSHPEETKRKMGAANERSHRERKQWDADNEPVDSERFLCEILPSLQAISLRKMADATGLSLRYCADIRKGRVPHARHWETLRRLQ